jgi:hypothetical protein
LPEKKLGYRALIASGHIDLTKAARLSKDDYEPEDDALHVEFLNKTFDLNDTSGG